MDTFSDVQRQIPAAPGYGAVVYAAKLAVGARGEASGALHLSRLRQVLHVEARPEHTQTAALRQGATFPVSLLPQTLLPEGQP